VFIIGGMRTKIWGFFLCFTSFILFALFIFGLVSGSPWSFWAIAVPVIIGFLIALALIFWIGFNMVIAREEKKDQG